MVGSARQGSSCTVGLDLERRGRAPCPPGEGWRRTAGSAFLTGRHILDGAGSFERWPTYPHRRPSTSRTSGSTRSIGCPNAKRSCVAPGGSPSRRSIRVRIASRPTLRRTGSVLAILSGSSRPTAPSGSRRCWRPGSSTRSRSTSTTATRRRSSRSCWTTPERPRSCSTRRSPMWSKAWAPSGWVDSAPRCPCGSTTRGGLTRFREPLPTTTSRRSTPMPDDRSSNEVPRTPTCSTPVARPVAPKASSGVRRMPSSRASAAVTRCERTRSPSPSSSRGTSWSSRSPTCASHPSCTLLGSGWRCRGCGRAVGWCSTRVHWFRTRSGTWSTRRVRTS